MTAAQNTGTAVKPTTHYNTGASKRLRSSWAMQQATFGARVLRIVADAKAAKAHQPSMPGLERVKPYVLKVVSIFMGGGGYDHDGLVCQVCQATFRRDQERHRAGCVFC